MIPLIAFVGAKVSGGNLRLEVVKFIIKTLEEMGCEVPSQHNGSENPVETYVSVVGPEAKTDHNSFRDQDYIWIDKCNLAVYEISERSHGVGAEFEHTRLKSRMGLPETPVLCLFDVNHDRALLSPMINGVSQAETNIWIREYADLDNIKNILADFMIHFFGRVIYG